MLAKNKQNMQKQEFKPKISNYKRDQRQRKQEAQGNSLIDKKRITKKIGTRKMKHARIQRNEAWTHK